MAVKFLNGIDVDGSMNIAASDVPNLDASKITSGTFSTDRIPNLSGTYQPVGNYLTSIPSEYLTQTEGDARYLQSLPSHNHDTLYDAIGSAEAVQTFVNEQNFATDAAISTAVSNYLPLSGGTLSGNLTVGAVGKTSDTVVRSLADQSYKAGFEAYGNGQGTGYVYVGQSLDYGGGFSYNGDNSPGFIGGETADNITFFRRQAGTNTEVFHYAYSNNDVYFNGAVVASGSNSNNWNTAYGWGNHASAGYLTSIPSSYATDAEVNSAVSVVNDRIDTEILPSIPTNNNQLTNGAGYLTTSGKAADSNLLDGINSTQFVRSDTNSVTIGRHLDANTTWTNSALTLFLGWYGGKLVIGNDNDGGHDYASALGGNTIPILNNTYFWKTAKFEEDVQTDGKLNVLARTGTWITSNVMADSIGWNVNHGVYIGSNVGGTHYLRGNGKFTTGGSTYDLWHEGNFNPTDKASTESVAAVNARIDQEVIPAINDLGNAIPTNNNQLTNGAGYITSADGGNAGTLDGIDSTGFVKQLGDTNSPNYFTPSSRRVDPNATNPTNAHYAITTFGNGGNVTGQLATHFQTGKLYSRGYNTSWSAWQTYATESYVNAAVSNLVASAPAALDTLNELAAALGDDANFSTTVANNIGAIDTRIDTEVFDAISNVAGSIPTNNNQLTNGAGYLTTSGKAADSNLLDGLDLGGTRANVANKVVRTDGNGYTNFGWINTTSGNTTSTLTDIYVNTNDGYIRKATPAHFRSQITDGVYDPAGSAAAVDSRIETDVLPAIPTNNNQLTNGAGYITAVPSSFSTNSITVGGGVTLSESTDRADLLMIKSSTSTWGGLQISNTSNEIIFSLMGDGTTGGIYDDQNSDWLIQWTENAGVRLYHNAGQKLTTTSTGITITGEIVTTGGNSTNWNTAYGWGNHTSAGYLTSIPSDYVRQGQDIVSGNIHPVGDRQQLLGLDSNRWQIVFCEILDSAGQHEKNLQNPVGEKSVADYLTGTVMVWENGKNVPCTTYANHMRMGIAVENVDSPMIQGAEPVLVTGAVAEGDYLVTSTTEGHAVAVSRDTVKEEQLWDCVIGKALEGGKGESHLIKTWVTI